MEEKVLDVIVDTDIGTDVDDAYAALFALSCPELRVRGMTVVHGDVNLRAMILFKLLKAAGRMDVPVALGERRPINTWRRVNWAGHEGRGLDLSDVAKVSPAGESAVEFIARTAAEHPGEIVLITIGPMTNAGVLVRDFPREASKLRGIVSMASSFEGYGAEKGRGEHNAAVDPDAVALVLASGIPTTLVGLNVTMQTALTSEHLEQIRAAGTPLAQLMAHMTDDWFALGKMQSTHMHDPLGVAVAFDEAVVTTVPVKAEVNMEEPGRVNYFEAGPDSPLSICDSIDTARFHEIFLTRILAAVR